MAESTAKTIASDIDIVNLALLKLGVEAISDFDDSSNVKAANLAKGTYDLYLKTVMEQYPWDFCTSFVELSSTALPADVYDYAAAFKIPGGTLRVFSVQGQSSEDGAEWKVSGKLILTNLVDDTEKLKTQIIKFDRNVEGYSPTFIDAVAERLAAEWSGSLIGSTSETELRHTLQRDKVRDAMSSDGGVGSPVRTTSVATVVQVRRA